MRVLVCAALVATMRGVAADWAVVTGASSGIGAALANRAARTHDVVLHGRNREALERVANEIHARTGRATKIVVCDLAKPRGARRLHAACKDLKVALLCANAGVARVRPFADDSLEAVHRMLDVNLRSTITLSRLFSEKLRGGRLVLTGSLVGVPAHGCAGCAAYAGSKAFLRSFGNALHDELRPRGVGRPRGKPTSLCGVAAASWRVRGTVAATPRPRAGESEAVRGVPRRSP